MLEQQQSKDVVKLSSITIRAVSGIGEEAATEIDATAEALLAGAQEVVGNLHQLAEAIREHTSTASKQLSEFCDKACLVLAGTRDLQTRLANAGQALAGQQADGQATPRQPGRQGQADPPPAPPTAPAELPGYLSRELAKAAEQLNGGDHER